MHDLKKILALLLVVITYTACGRKQRTLFQFPEKESVPLNKLTLPAPRGLQVITQGNDALLTWQPVTVPSTNNQSNQCRLIGYHVYRFAKGGFVSNHPITKQPVSVTQFLDSSHAKNKHRFFYIIRATFTIDNQIIQGPASHLASITTV